MTHNILSIQAGHDIPKTHMRRSSWLLAALHLAVLCSFAIAQPIYELLNVRSPDFVILYRLDTVELIVLASILLAGPPAALLAVEAIANLFSMSLRLTLHKLFLGLLFALLAMQLLDRLTPGWLALTAGCGLGLAFIRYANNTPIQFLMNLLAPAPVIFIVAFLFFSPTAQDASGSYPEPLRLTKAPKKDAGPIVVVVFDELPVTSLMDQRRRIRQDALPYFAKLADASTWFAGALTPSSHTKYAVPAILTGRQTALSDAGLATRSPYNLFTLLGRYYNITAYEHSTYLCTTNFCDDEKASTARTLVDLVSTLVLPYIKSAIPDGVGVGGTELLHGLTLQDLLAETFQPTRNIDGREVTHARRSAYPDAEFNQFVEQINAERPGRSMYFIHSSLPHFPWRYSPEGEILDSRYAPVVGLQEMWKWADNEAVVAVSSRRHLMQVDFVDRLLGRLMKRLQNLDLYDRATIVVTADHGASLIPGERFRDLTETNVGNIASVPLFLKLPKSHRSKRVLTRVSTLDVLPTIAEILGIRLPWEVDGESLLSQRPSQSAEVVRLVDAKGNTRVYSTAALTVHQRRALRWNAHVTGK